MGDITFLVQCKDSKGRVLSNAVPAHLDNQVIVSGSRTIVFSK